ncbi:MAG: M14 family metallopeptidase [Henriciella sp.]|nr:M14 family metallopeptidase [Henriciella sp.]
MVFAQLNSVWRGLVASVLVWGLAPILALAQPYVQADYDPDIPTQEQIVGFASGEQITTSEEILLYMEALEAAAPDRMKIVPYATSWQGRSLVYGVISSPETMARLDEVKSDLAQLGAGENLSESELQALAQRTPAVVWLSYGVHGDEISPSDSAIALAYHLLAAQNDALVDRILENTIVIIDPNQNPDGRARFVHFFESSLGLEPQSDRYTVEHDRPWPRGRFNHYIFDLNRDWFAMTQPETIGKVEAYLEWHPIVFVDSHEMGGDETYYFPPPADPLNPNITGDQREKQTLFGLNRASWFDRFGISYFTREIFDAFYPGYGDMWPTLNGSIAQTFEQGSARGLLFERRNGEMLTYRETVRNNFIASLATAETVANDSAGFQLAYAQYRRSAVELGQRSDERYILLDLSVRRWQAEDLARRLERQGIEVERLSGSLSLCGEDYPNGALIVDTAQPNGRLINTLLNRDTALPPDFVAEQESRRDRGLEHELYDVTAWSMPLMDGLSATTCRRVDLGDATPVSADDPTASILPGQPAAFGYAVPWTDAGQAQLVVAALKAGLDGRATDQPFTQSGRVFPRGTVIFSVSDNEDDLQGQLTRLARDVGAELVALQTSWVEDGPNFGSSSFNRLHMPKVAMAWGEGTGASTAGNTRFVFERQLGLPVSPIRVSTLGFADLSRYDVLILPPTGWGFQSRLGASGQAALKKFANEGGVLIGFGSAIDTLADEEIGLLSTQREKAFISEDAQEDLPEDDTGLRITDQASYEALIEDPDARPEGLPGALMRVEADGDHWLASGYVSATALVTGDAIYRPLNEGDGKNVFYFSGPETLVESGYVWEENRLQLAYKPFVMAQSSGDGLVIGFTQNPTTRAYLNGLNLLLANAVLLGPAQIQ